MRFPRTLLCLPVLVLFACSGSDGAPGTPAAPPPLGPGDDLPGVNVVITSITGASLGDGSFASGDRITVRFTVRDDDGNGIPLSDLDRARAQVSGPSFNYQRVIATQDMLPGMTQAGDGFEYSFPALPGAYLDPINPDMSRMDDVLSGQALLAGTYTLGLELRAPRSVGSDSFRDVGNVTADFRFGGAPSLDTRSVVLDANCNQCHGELNYHGGNRTLVTNCLLCHTAGSGDSAGESIEFKVMVHKIHTGKHLAQVLGVSTDGTGQRTYNQTPRPYVVGGTDYSGVGYPAWPSTAQPMPRDVGYGLLSPAEQALEDTMRSGVVDCASCHGDPDGTGPLTAPPQGDLINTQLTRRACGSCHDDWVWDRPYTANGATMPAQTDDTTCAVCHQASGDALDVIDGHRHPLVDPSQATGVHFNVTAVAEAGTNDSDGTIDPGEKVALTFSLEDDGGNPVTPSDLSRFEVVLNGPTTNPNLVLWESMPTAALTGGGPSYTVNVPDGVFYEILGTSSASNGDLFGTARTPHWNLSGALTTVYTRGATGAASTLAAAATVRQNFIDVDTGDGALFARDDVVVLEDGIGGQEEYLRIQWVEGDRLWFSSQATRSYAPALTRAHALGSTVAVVTLAAKTQGSDYSLDTVNGQITELIEFGTGVKVLCSYTSDFLMPSDYEGTINESPGLDESWGDWVARPIVAGTYTVGLHAVRAFDVTVPGGQVTGYNDASQQETFDFLVGDASTIVPNGRIDDVASCVRCHGDLAFHGNGRRGYETCLLCHGVAGAEDRPRYVAANAPATDGVPVDFRTMLHKLHHGQSLAEAASYQLVGFGSDAHPDNFSVQQYDKVGFPTVGGTSDCASCHGSSNTAWQSPAERNHPSGQTLVTRSWRAVCGSCHDSSAAQAHIEVNTSPSIGEACSICHGPGQDQAVDLVHKVR